MIFLILAGTAACVASLNVSIGQRGLPHIVASRIRSTEIEKALEPDLPIIDPHHHFDVPGYELDALLADITRGGHNITKTVFIQCAPVESAVEEVVTVQRFADQARSRGVKAEVAAGIVGSAELLGPGVAETIGRQMDASPNVRGIRYRGGKAHTIPFDDPRLHQALGIIADLGLVFDINGPEVHPLDLRGVLGGIASLARAFPRLTVVVDHIGGAIGPLAFGGHPERQRDWEEGIASLATHPNVVMKIGGLQMEVNGFPLGAGARAARVGSGELARLTLPYYGHVIRAFGAKRCMFESNFPVDKWGVDYDVLWNTFKRIAAELRLSTEDKAAIFHGTAARVYKLKP